MTVELCEVEYDVCTSLQGEMQNPGNTGTFKGGLRRLKRAVHMLEQASAVVFGVVRTELRGAGMIRA